MRSDQTIFVTGYSYKGGSGRTTTAVNLAATLMALGHLVVVIDADFGAGGLRTVAENLGMTPRRAPPEAGVHQYVDAWLRRKRDAEKDILLYGNGFFNDFDYWGSAAGLASIRGASDSTSGVSFGNRQAALGDKLSGVGRLAAVCEERSDGTKPPMSGELLLIPGSYARHYFDDSAPHGFGDIARALQDLGLAGVSYLRRCWRERGCAASPRGEPLAFVFLDAASGIGADSLPALAAAHVIVQFFRFSSQHDRGARENIRKTIAYLYERRLTDNIGRAEQDVLVAGTCVPLEDELKTFERIGKGGGLGTGGVPVFLEAAKTIDEIASFWQRASRGGLAGRFGRAVTYVGSFPEHPLLRHREDLAVLNYLPPPDELASNTDYLLFWTAHQQFVNQCVDVALKLVERHRERTDGVSLEWNR